MAPSPGVTEFGLENPAVGSEIDKFRRVILARQRYERQADTDNGLLSPLDELLSVHHWAAFEVHRKAKSRRQEAGAVHKSLGFSYLPPEIPNTVWQRNKEIGAATEKL